MEYQNYNAVPWYRKSGTNSWFILLGLFIPPFIWAVAYMLATGDIYYNKIDSNNNLKKWSVANKVVAWIIVIAQLYFWIIRRFI
jgi:hypothetical protein